MVPHDLLGLGASQAEEGGEDEAEVGNSYLLHPVRQNSRRARAHGGGLGQAIHNNVQLVFYPRLSTLILLTYALVLTSDWIGERLRLRVA